MNFEFSDEQQLLREQARRFDGALPHVRRARRA